MPNSPSEPIVLGIDPGLASVGLAVMAFSPRSTRVLHYETIRTDAEDDDGERMEGIARRLFEIIEEYKPSVMGFEDQAGAEVGKQERMRRAIMAGNTSVRTSFSSHRVHEVVGIIRCCGAFYDLPLPYAIPTRSVKVAILGPGGAKRRPRQEGKDAIKQAVRTIFRIECDEHAADAIAVAVATVRRFNKDRAEGAAHAALIH